MGTISLDDFKKLSDKEKCIRYKDLSNHDKYIFRVTDPSPFLSAETVRYKEVTEEEKTKNERKKQEIITAIRRN